MIEEFSTVRLKKSIPGNDIPVGSIGTIVMVHHLPFEAYEVEFFDEEGNTLRDTQSRNAVFTLDENYISLLSPPK